MDRVGLYAGLMALTLVLGCSTPPPPPPPPPPAPAPEPPPPPAPEPPPAPPPETHTVAQTFSNLPGMGAVTASAITFNFDLGRAFDPAKVTLVHVFVDTDSLNYSQRACRDGVSAFCADSIRLHDVHSWQLPEATTHGGSHDGGEHGYFDSSRNVEQFPAARSAVADGRVTVTVTPSPGDDYKVQSIYFEVQYTD